MPLGAVQRVLMRELGGEPWSLLSAGPGGKAWPGAWPWQALRVVDVVKPVPVLHQL